MMEQREEKYDLEKGMKWIIGFGLGVFALLMLMAVVMFFRSSDLLTYDIKGDCNNDSISIAFHYIPISEDNLSTLHGNWSDDLVLIDRDEFKKVDSLAEIVVQNQKSILCQQENIVADLRQETNNNLVKIDSWLSFWIGVLAFLGVIVPLATQYVMYRKEHEWSERVVGDLKEKYDKEKEKYKEIIEEKKKEIDKLTDQYKTDLNGLKILNITSGLNINAVNRLIETGLQDIDFRRQLWRDIIGRFSELHAIFKEMNTKEFSENRITLILALVHLQKDIDILADYLDINSREVAQLSSMIHNIIDRAYSDGAKDEIDGNLEKLYNWLRQIPI